MSQDLISFNRGRLFSRLQGRDCREAYHPPYQSSRRFATQDSPRCSVLLQGDSLGDRFANDRNACGDRPVLAPLEA